MTNYQSGKGSARDISLYVSCMESWSLGAIEASNSKPATKTRRLQDLKKQEQFRRIITDMITLSVEIEQEEDGRWIAEVAELPGVLAYGTSIENARAKAQALALRVVADRLEHGEAGPDFLSISFKAA